MGFASAVVIGVVGAITEDDRPRISSGDVPSKKLMEREKGLSMTDLVIKSVNNSEFSFKPRKISKSEILPLSFFGVIGVIVLAYLVMSANASWLLGGVVIFGIIVIPKIVHDQNHKTNSYREYLSGFQDYQLHQALKDADQLSLDEDTILAIKSYLGEDSKL